MSAAFDNFIMRMATIKSDIDDADVFTVGERIALDLLLESLKNRNQRKLSIAKTCAKVIDTTRPR